MNFANDLKKYKEEKGLSWTDVARNLKVSQSAPFQWIKGKHGAKQETLDRFYSLYKPKSEEIKQDKPVVKLKKPMEKVVITSAEDVIDALKDKKLVYDDFFNRYYMMVDGYICCFDQKSDNLLSVNTVVLMENEIYIYQEKKILVQIGKTYLTDEGEKIVVVAENLAFKLGSSESVQIDKYGNPFNIVGEI